MLIGRGFDYDDPQGPEPVFIRTEDGKKHTLSRQQARHLAMDLIFYARQSELAEMNKVGVGDAV